MAVRVCVHDVFVCTMIGTCQQHGDREASELWSALQLKLPDFFASLDITPALIHGDLWNGNAAQNESGPGERLQFKL